jgi:hypothetical protein
MIFCLIAKRGVAISGCPGFEDLQDEEFDKNLTSS